MIVDIDLLKEEKELANVSEDILKRKLRAIEKSIRKYTNNKFLYTYIKFFGEIKDNKIVVSAMPYLKEKDNIQLSRCLNNDVFTIMKIDDFGIEVDGDLYDSKMCMITKVVYPEDIQEGVINMLKWDFGLRKKVGIKSETISRHSVTYFDMNKDNTLKRIPSSITWFFRRLYKSEVLA